MVYIEAPDRTDPGKKGIFLAGGITGVSDWQKELREKISSLDIAVYNPRRANFDIKDPNASRKQITWEHDMLRKANIISFWFAPEAIQPIVLYECGAWTMTQKPILIGVDPKYQRKQDVEIQTELARPEVKIVSTLDDLANQILQFFGGKTASADWVGQFFAQK